VIATLDWMTMPFRLLTHPTYLARLVIWNCPKCNVQMMVANSIVVVELVRPHS